MKTLLSIIVPVYNTALPLLEKCLDPFTRYDDSRIELIIVDDGSNEQTAKFLDNIEFACSSKIIHVENGGQNHARNIGISKASGKFVGFLDSDDSVDLIVLDQMLNDNLWNNDIIVYCASIVNSRGDIVGQMCKTNSVSKREYIRNCAELWLQFIRLDFLKDNGGLFLFEGQCIGEDLATILPLVIKARYIAYTNYALYRYTKHQGSVIHSLDSDSRLSVLTAFNRLLSVLTDDEFREFHDEIEWQVINHILNYETRFQLSFGRRGLHSVQTMRGWVEARFPNWKFNPYIKQEISKQGLRLRIALNQNYILLMVLQYFNYLFRR
ncbi:glycosyl transferase [Bifidobacterium ramosum]|uniref:Glycosyl transferase n=1 Tax=Bifidobacterium ramosum TaxID=1798158 RepID=A0A6L4WYT8_9BIFI|nr:glycosyltransferase [Bifidobacterium ramosum]KAB8287250.1 glycosyl transferase [Bifidobacterium ramosum]NEG71961.1 glycosyltransferase [Bifidobacterium ramosum]